MPNVPNKQVNQTKQILDEFFPSNIFLVKYPSDEKHGIDKIRAGLTGLKSRRRTEETPMKSGKLGQYANDIKTNYQAK